MHQARVERLQRRPVGVAPSTVTLSLPDGSTIALADWIDDKLYGTVQLSNGQTTPVEAFATGRSQPIPGGSRSQTRVDTNIPRSGDNGLPKDWSMLVYGIGMKYVRVAEVASGSQPTLASTSLVPVLETMFGIDRVLSFSFEYNGKGYSTGVSMDYPQGNGFNLFTSTVGVEYVSNGRPSPRDRVAFVLPINMRENLGYKGVFQPEAALVISQSPAVGNDQFCDLKTYLFGLIKRAVV